VGSFPFNYLGVPIFRGKPKSTYLQPIDDRIKLKLSSWKASLHSIAGRVQLVKSVIQGMLIHSISVYSWPASLLKDIEKCIRNFIWSGDIEKIKMVTVTWHKVCKPYDEGGLRIRSLAAQSSVSNLKLCWELHNSDEPWARILRARVLRGNKVIRYHIYSSIWSSIKVEHEEVLLNSSWNIGNGQKLDFWKDN